MHLRYTKSKLPDNKKLRREGDNYYLGDKKVIPAEEVDAFLKSYYDDPTTGLRGRDGLYSKISREYVGVSRRAVANFLANQETAQLHKALPAIPITRPAVLKKEGQLAVDLTWLKRHDPNESDLKDSQILFTCIDLFSKYAWVRILPNKTGPTVAKAMQSVIDDIKQTKSVMPTIVKSDNGSEFKANDFGAVLKAVGTKQKFSEAYNPRQNAVVERFNKTIKSMLYKYMTQWNVSKIDNATLQKLVKNYNETVHSTTGSAPIDIHGGGKDAKLYSELAHSNMRVRAKKLVAENNATYPPVKIGDRVRVAWRTVASWRKTRTLKQYSAMKQWTYELFTIAGKTRGSTTKSVTYTLKDDNNVVLTDQSDHPKQFVRQDLQIVDTDKLVKELDRGEYVVDRVIDKKKVRGKVKYLAYFVGYEEPEWISPQSSFQTAIDAYEATLKK